MVKVTVFICEEHGEVEVLGDTITEGYCIKCGKSMKKTGVYEE